MKIVLMIVMSLFMSACGQQISEQESSPVKVSIPEGHQIATFAGGCFWCIEAGMETVEGVHEAIAGYAGGEEVNPTYQQVASGQTGHAEVVQVIYDPNNASYNDLLQVFWRYIDPTDAGGQYVDRGSQYRTIIFYHDQQQKKLAEQSKQEEAKKYDQPIVTTIEPYTDFYPAEEYHQDYYKKAPERYDQYKNNSGRPKDL